MEDPLPPDHGELPPGPGELPPGPVNLPQGNDDLPPGPPSPAAAASTCPASCSPILGTRKAVAGMFFAVEVLLMVLVSEVVGMKIGLRHISLLGVAALVVEWAMALLCRGDDAGTGTAGQEDQEGGRPAPIQPPTRQFIVNCGRIEVDTHVAPPPQAQPQPEPGRRPT